MSGLESIPESHLKVRQKREDREVVGIRDTGVTRRGIKENITGCIRTKNHQKHKTRDGSVESPGDKMNPRSSKIPLSFHEGPFSTSLTLRVEHTKERKFLESGRI